MEDKREKQTIICSSPDVGEVLDQLRVRSDDGYLRGGA